jgi:aspartyl/asparaginyl beta-hydroxylase (cupin superfamily)
MMHKQQINQPVHTINITDPTEGFSDRVKFALGQFMSRGKNPHVGTNQLQKPAYFYFPGLEDKPWHENIDAPWVKQLEDNYEVIKCEVEKLLDQVPPERYEKEAGSLPYSFGKWRVFYLFKSGAKLNENCTYCPETAKIIDNIPDLITGMSLGFAMFSVLDPHGHIQPHFGPMNLRLRCMLPIIVPDGCTITVGEQKRELHPGKCVFFDDSFQHESHNESDKPRIVLIIDIWHPSLTADERTQVRALLNQFEAMTPATFDST